MKIIKYILIILVSSGCSGVDYSRKSSSNEVKDARDISNEYDSESAKRKFANIEKNFELGRVDEAIRVLRNILDDEMSGNYSKTKASLELAEHYSKNNEFFNAVQLYGNYASFFYELTPEEKDRFDFFKENGSLVLLRSANIAEYKLTDFKLAKNIYLTAVEIADKNDKAHLYYIYEELGDYYVRRGELDSAVPLYKKSINEINSFDYPFVGSLARPMYKLLSVYIETFDWVSAREIYSEILKRFADTEYAIDKHYFDKAKKLVVETPQVLPE